MCIVHTKKGADLIKEAEHLGWTLDRITGSHHHFTKPGRAPLVIPHPKKDLGKGISARLRKQARQ